jgi:glycosyltransferase involved in cell wall biosynthesis
MEIGRLALVHDFLFTFGGAERVLQTVSKAYPDAPIYTCLADPAIIAKHFPTSHIITSHLQRHPLRRWPRLLLGSYPAAIESFDLSQYDTVLSFSGAFAKGSITGPHTNHICYCHTPMRYAWDWHHQYLEENNLTRGPLGWMARRTLHNLRLWDSLSASRVDRYVANSNVVAKRISKYYRQTSTVIHPPVDSAAFQQPFQEKQSFILTVSRLTPNKQIDCLFPLARPERPLYVIGSGSDRKRLELVAKKMGAPVHFLGNVSDEQKYIYMSQAQAFLFPAEDDFGLAPAEAMACGTPAIVNEKSGVAHCIQPAINGWAINFQQCQTIERLISDCAHLQPRQVRQSVQELSESTFLQHIEELLHG